MAENDFLIFANNATNIESQPNYVADAAVPAGVSSGIASSAQFNKVARQATTGMALLAAFIQQQLPNQTVLDQGAAGLSTLLSSLTQALEAIVSPWVGSIWADTGTTNGLVVTLSPTPASLTSIEGVTLKIAKSATANTSSLSLDVNNLGAVPLVKSDGSAFSSGQWPAGAIGDVVYTGSQFVCLSLTFPSLVAPLASPAFTGIPTAPTASVGTATTQLATTAFVNEQGFITSAGAPVQSVAGLVGAITKSALLTALGVSLSAGNPGYFFGFGMGFQWGANVVTNGSSIVTLPTPFPNNSLQVICSYDAFSSPPTGYACGGEPINATEIKLWNTSPSGNLTRWLAIGY